MNINVTYHHVIIIILMDIPEHHVQCVWQTIEHRSKVKVKVTENTKTTIWAITFEDIETFGWFQNVPCQNTYQKCRVPMTYDVPFLRHVASNKTYNCCIFSNFVNFVPIDLKIGTHIDWTYTILHLQNCTNKNNVTHISMATKYPIIKHRAFFKTLTAAYHPFILDGFHSYWTDSYETSHGYSSTSCAICVWQK